ncbi:MAG: HigA family addiction module antidote protein [Deltaproteobacteria bacterium]|nr:HigA family addiction module antidote protein [Deltaproteobacteria bacterium]
MAIANTKKRLIPPTHPGVILREDFMPDYGLSVSALATALKVSRQTVNELLNGRRSLTSIMALRLSLLFGNSSRFWMNAQVALDLWSAEQDYRQELKGIHLLKAA